MRTRPPAVAGMFYPGSAKELNAMVNSLLASAADSAGLNEGLHSPRPRALIVPHAGYIYSGMVAARAYALVRDQHYARVVLLGPAHRVALRGLALPAVEAFATPLGSVPLATELIEKLSDFPGVSLRDDAHAEEHALEVQLPFLQALWADAPPWTLLPVVVGFTAPETVAAFLSEVVDTDTLVIISTDLSHFHRYVDAQKIDVDTVCAIVNLRSDIHGEQACGAYPLNGFARYAQAVHWSVQTLAQCNSGDTAGDKQRVVGYASFSVH